MFEFLKTKQLKSFGIYISLRTERNIKILFYEKIELINHTKKLMYYYKNYNHEKRKRSIFIKL
jgi:hypothetical protein